MQIIGDIPRLNARRYPNKTALIMDDDSLTYQQLNTQVNQLAHGLLSLGMQSGDRVAILAFNCLEYPVINYAVAKTGGILVPINFRYKRDELVYVVNNSDPKILFFGPEFLPMVSEAKEKFSSPVRLAAISGETLEPRLSMRFLMGGKPTSEPGLELDPSSPSFIIYTSGTTGFPKGVLFSNSAYMSVFNGMVIDGDLRHDDVVMCCLPLFHNGGLNAMVQPTLMVGGTCLIMAKGFEPDKILDAVARYGVSLTMWVPTQLAMLVHHPGVNQYNVSTLKKIWYGSSAISPTVLEASMKIFNTGFYQWYGQTETGMNSILGPADHARWSQCTGREMYNAEIRIVDEDGKDTPIGQVGEIICAQKPLGMIGYYKAEEATRKTIRDGWIHTADLARVEGEGYFTIVDRLSDMIISGAENIYPKEIEDCISSHPAVREVAVIGIPDEIYGESVCAVVVRKKGRELSAEDVIQYCTSRLSGYKKPKKVAFIDELPKNPSGKVTKNVLREPYWAGRKKRV